MYCLRRLNEAEESRRLACSWIVKQRELDHALFGHGAVCRKTYAVSVDRIFKGSGGNRAAFAAKHIDKIGNQPRIPAAMAAKCAGFIALHAKIRHFLRELF